MKLSHLRDVLAVAECGSLRAAGRHLNIAQPAVTRSIHEIERELGVSLFERHAKGVRPTQMGEVFLRRARAIESELKRANEEIEQLKGRSQGQVSIAMSNASGIALWPSAMKTFRKRYPEAVLKVSECMFQAVESDVLDGQIDFYVGPIDPDVSNTRLHVEALYESQRVVVARKGHPLASARTFAELSGAQWVRPTLGVRSSEADFAKMFETLGIPNPDIVVQTQATVITLLSLVNSDMLTVLPSRTAEFGLFAEQVVPLDLDKKIPGVTISIVRRHDMPLTPMAEYLCDLVRRAGLNQTTRVSSR